MSEQTSLCWTVLKKMWAGYKQCLKAVFSSFQGQKKNKSFVLNIVAIALKSCLAQNRLRHTQLNV